MSILNDLFIHIKKFFQVNRIYKSVHIAKLIGIHSCKIFQSFILIKDYMVDIFINKISLILIYRYLRSYMKNVNIKQIFFYSKIHR